MTDETYGLLLPFDTDSPEFVRGFEAGRVWACLGACERDGHLLCSEEDGYGFTVHVGNDEMLLRIAERTGHTLTADLMCDEGVPDGLWMHATFTEAAL